MTNPQSSISEPSLEDIAEYLRTLFGHTTLRTGLDYPFTIRAPLSPGAPPLPYPDIISRTNALSAIIQEAARSSSSRAGQPSPDKSEVLVIGAHNLNPRVAISENMARWAYADFQQKGATPTSILSDLDEKVRSSSRTH